MIAGMSSPVQERKEVIDRLNAAVFLLTPSMSGDLVPETGCNIAYAIRGARTPADVAAVTGGLREERGSVRCAGPVAFGADHRIARAVLTVLKFDPGVRSAALIRSSGSIFRILSDMFPECVQTRPQERAGENGPMDWTIAACCSDGVPDAIAVTGSAPVDLFIWLFGEEPGRLASNIIILSNRIR